jgi:hypothetical protein
MQMTLAAVSADVVALIIDGTDDAAGLRGAVCSALTEAGCEPWRHMEAEIFTYGPGPEALVIARPAPPVLRRTGGRVRLKR